MNRELNARVPTSHAVHWRTNQRPPLLTAANETRRDILFLIAPESRPIMLEDRFESGSARQAFIAESEGFARDSVSPDNSHVTINREEYSWTIVVGRHSRYYPHIPETMAKQSLFQVACRNLCRRKYQRMSLT